MNTEQQLYDVVIVSCFDRKIESITGKNLPSEQDRHGSQTAEKRFDTTSGRLNDNYFAAIVEAGRYQKGGFLPENASIEL